MPHVKINHTKAARQAAARARELLSPALRVVQEAALRCGDPKLQLRLLRAAELIAATSSALFDLENESKGTFDSLAAMVMARDNLRNALAAVQDPGSESVAPAGAAEAVAQALAVVFAVAKGGDWQDTVDLRRERHRAQGRNVPPSEPKKPAPSVGPSRRAGVGAGAPPAREPATGSQRMVYPRPVDARRWNRRVTGRAVLEVDVGLVSDSNFYAGLSLDVSTGGLFVATYKPQPIGTRVAVSLVLPDGHAVWARGVVRWLRESRGDDMVPGMGVAFTHIDPEDMAAIERFCEMRAPMYVDGD